MEECQQPLVPHMVRKSSVEHILLKTVHPPAHKNESRTEQVDRTFAKQKKDRLLYTNHKTQPSKRSQVHKNGTKNYLPFRDQHHICERVAVNPHKSHSREPIHLGKNYTFQFGRQSHSMAVSTPPIAGGMETSDLVGERQRFIRESTIVRQSNKDEVCLEIVDFENLKKRLKAGERLNIFLEPSGNL